MPHVIFNADLDSTVLASLSPPMWSGGLSKIIVECCWMCNLTLRVIRSENHNFWYANKYQVWTYDLVSPITWPWDYHFCVKWQFFNVWAYMAIPRLPEGQKALGRAPGGPPPGGPTGRQREIKFYHYCANHFVGRARVIPLLIQGATD